MIEINKIRLHLKDKNPLIHCITNPIAANQSANALLCLGASPIMAEHPGEVNEITKSANALLVNLGNITPSRLNAIKKSAKSARKNSIPFVLDAVGVACSSLRKKEARRILKFMPSIIKGNYSEIYALSDKNYSSTGVDADKMLSDTKVKKSAIELARKYSCTVMASGKCDIVTDGKTLVRIENGVEMLGGVTGTGCMLGAICAAFLSVSKSIEAAVSACVVSGICGELSETDKGSGSFIINLLDNLKILSDDTISEKERIKIEKV